MGSQLRDLGKPVFNRATVGDSADGALLGGYSLVTAQSLDDAVTLAKDCPILAAGGGPSGLAAAIATARAGAEVSLLERFGCFGGNLTVVGVEGLAWYRHEAPVEAGGIGREFEAIRHVTCSSG
jgi:NADPH-dependent 2,4-dienoyl-CoA reductase/sulfur reductase-like enzyme